MQIDESGANDLAAGIDDMFSLGVSEISQSNNACAFNGDVSSTSWLARAINYRAPSKDYVDFGGLRS